jgi:ubiquinone/menaquinone biosynthesis C-methylase UbiE
MASQQSIFKWADSAFYWEKHRKTIEQMYSPLTEAIIRLGEMRSARKILDVAGGTGEPSLTIMKSDSPESIAVTDLSFDMLKCAKAESERRQLHNMMFCRCHGERLPFGDSHFDRVVSRLGIMFFPDVVQGLREMLRVLVPGGRIVVAVWHRADTNPMFHLVTEHLKRYVSLPAEVKEQDDPFRFASKGALSKVARDAGANNIREEELEFSVRAPVLPEQFWELRTELSETLRDKLNTLSEQKRIALQKEVEESVRPYFTESHMSFPARTVLMTCTK